MAAHIEQLSVHIVHRNKGEQGWNIAVVYLINSAFLSVLLYFIMVWLYCELYIELEGLFL